MYFVDKCSDKFYEDYKDEKSIITALKGLIGLKR